MLNLAGVEVKATSWWLNASWVTVVHWNGVFFSSKVVGITMDKNPSTMSVGWWSSRRKVIGRSRWMNIQQSGGTGRSSLWMECCQFALRVWTEAWVFKFPVTVLVAVLGELLPLYSRQDQQFQNRIQNVHLQSSVISWQALLGHRSTSWKSGTLEFMVVAPVKSVSTPTTADTSRTPILDICVLSWNFKLLSSSWFVSLFLQRKAF